MTGAGVDDMRPMNGGFAPTGRGGIEVAPDPADVRGPSPVRRVSPLTDAVERLSDYVATGIVPTGDVREMLSILIDAFITCGDTNDAIRLAGREMMWAVEPLTVQGEMPHVERFGVAASAFRQSIR